MPVMTVHTRDGEVVTVPLSPAISVLNTLMRNDIPTQHKCGGRAQCGTCRLRILKGAEYLSSVKEKERIRLEAVDAPSDYRLACQLFAFGDITVEILPLSQE